MKSIEQVKARIESRIESNRLKLESLGTSEAETLHLRGRIAEAKDLLAALNDKALPDLNYASGIDA